MTVSSGKLKTKFIDKKEKLKQKVQKKLKITF